MRAFVVLPHVENPDTWEDTPGQTRTLDGMFVREVGGLASYSDEQLQAELDARRARRARRQRLPR